MSSRVAETIRRSYACYPAKDRATHEALIAPDFHFTSPYDDHIDRAEYFRRCWPNADKIRALEIEQLFVEGDDALVRYRVQLAEGPVFRNVDYVRTAGGKIREVEVYFGSLPKAG
jgi:ketosteroid isomerase-like protein